MNMIKNFGIPIALVIVISTIVMFLSCSNRSTAETNLPLGTNIPLESSQYNIVKVKRLDLTQTGELTFKLLDETGEERSTVTCEVLD